MLARSRFLARLFACQLLLIVAAMLLAGWIGQRALEAQARTDLEADLARRVELLAAGLAGPVETGDEAAVARALARVAEAQEVRLTLLTRDGTVRADSRADPRALDNQSLRPEIAAALRGDRPAIAWSAGPEGPRGHAALPLGERHLLRISLPPPDIRPRTTALWRALAIAALVAVLLGSWLVLYVGRQVALPLRAVTEAAQGIAAGDYQRRVRVPREAEVGRLASAFNSMADQLQTRVEGISTDRNKLLAILGSMVEGVVAVDRDERVLHMNHVAGTLLDARPEASVGRPIWQVTRTVEVIDTLAETIRTGGETTGEVLLPGEAGELRLELHGSPLRDHQQQVVGAILVLHDVTRIRRLEAIRRDFVANVSHELKTPLAAIRGVLETILDDPEMDEATRTRFLGRARDQTIRLGNLVGDLLTLSRVESRETPAEPRLVDLRESARESVRGLEHDAAGKSLAVATQLPDAPVWVLADPEGLRQVVDNLVDNAIKYTNAGGRIDVRVRADDGAAVLEVADTGIGIARRDLDRIFERFYRVDQARSRELGGTGLGLSIVKNVILRHGGQVEVDSTPGRGSTFRITLPISRQSA